MTSIIEFRDWNIELIIMSVGLDFAAKYDFIKKGPDKENNHSEKLIKQEEMACVMNLLIVPELQPTIIQSSWLLS